MHRWHSVRRLRRAATTNAWSIHISPGRMPGAVRAKKRTILSYSGVCFWHETDLPRCPQFGRDRGESGHNSDIVKPTRLTQSGPRRPEDYVARLSRTIFKS